MQPAADPQRVVALKDVCLSVDEKSTPAMGTQDTGTQTFRPQEPTSEPAAKHWAKWRIIAVTSAICLAAFATNLDTVIVSTSLPSIAQVFNMSPSAYSWAVASEILADAALLPLWGALSDRLGRKPIFACGIAVAMMGNLLAALASNTAMLIAARAVQGIGGGVVAALAVVCISDMFTLRQRPLYIAMYAGSSCLGVAIAPIVGGLLTQYAGWRWIFWIELPLLIGPLILALMYLDIPRKLGPDNAITQIDWIGSFLVVSATCLLLAGLQSGGVNLAWNSAGVISMLVLGAIVFAAFVVHEIYFAARPLILPALFRTQTSCACLLVCMAHGAVYVSVLVYLPFWFRFVRGRGPVTTGLWLLAIALPVAIFTIGGALIISIRGRYRSVIRISSCSLTIGLGLLIALPGAGGNLSTGSILLLIAAELLVSAGIGILFQAPLIPLQAATSSWDATAVTATYQFLRQISAAISVVIGQVFIQGLVRKSSEALAQEGIPQEVLDGVLKNLGTLDSGELSEQQLQTLRQAFAHPLSRLWLLYTVVALVTVFGSLAIKHYSLSASDTEDQAEVPPGN